jgi:PAS domain S-box-containing protein
MPIEDVGRAFWEHPAIEAIQNAAPALIVVLDLDGRIIRFNRACQDATGYAREEALGRPVWDFLLPADQIDGVKRVFARLLAQDAEVTDSRSYPYRYENEWIAKDGHRLSILWSNDSARDRDGRVVAIVGAGLDITERKGARAHAP